MQNNPLENSPMAFFAGLVLAAGAALASFARPRRSSMSDGTQYNR